jgi:Tfp pilus assembly protein PilN
VTDFSTHRRARPRYKEVTLLAGGACVLAVAAWGAVRARADVNAARARVEEAARALGEARDRVRVLEGEAASGAEQALAARVVLAAQVAPTAALDALAQTLPSDVRLDELSLVYEGDIALELHVAARRAAAYDEFLARLTSSPHFRDVVPGAEESREASLSATVHARYRRAGR